MLKNSKFPSSVFPLIFFSADMNLILYHSNDICLTLDNPLFTITEQQGNPLDALKLNDFCQLFLHIT